MADLKISALPAITTLDGADEFVVAASGVTNKITAADAAASLGASMALIQEIVVGSGGSATVDFTSILGIYRHLDMYWFAQTENAAAQDFYMRFNGDTGSNYYDETFIASGTTNTAAKAEAVTVGRVGILTATGESQPAAGKITIPYYTSTTNRKIATSEWGSYFSSNSKRGMTTVMWTNTAAITRVTLHSASSDVKEGSSFSLYGIV